MVLSKDEKKLIELCISQARIFLRDAGEFFPFGVSMDVKNRMHPIGVYVENENPESVEVVDILSKNILKGIKDGNYVCSGICIDVVVTKECEE